MVTANMMPCLSLGVCCLTARRNSASSLSIAKAIGSGEGLKWADDSPAEDFDILVYNQEFINENFSNYGDIAGVFTVCSDNKEKEEEAAKKSEEKKAVDDKIATAKILLQEKVSYRDGLLPTLQDTLFNALKSERVRFERVADGAKTKASLYKLINEVETPTDHNPDEIQKIYDVVFSDEQTTYKPFSRIVRTL